MISLAITVFNEEKTIEELLKSILSQTKKPDEVIIVDGNSTDRTFEKIKRFKEKYHKRILLKLFRKSANRPEGRNFAIDKSRGSVIAITDAGCILDRNWLKEITKPFTDQSVDVVSGYYKALNSSVFEKCVAAYTLVMPDKVDFEKFLPSARSMGIRKNVWKRAGGFPRNFPLNEDYVFAKKLKRHGFKFHFTKKAIVFWKPRENILKTFLMFYYFAKGDAMAGILRPKVFLIFARYIFVLWVLIISLSLSLSFMLQVIFYILIVYISWSIWKNYRYIQNSLALIYLPLLQFTSDLAVITGTSFGFFNVLWDTRHKL